MACSAAVLSLPASCTSTAASTVPAVVRRGCCCCSQHALALSSPHLRSTLTVALGPSALTSACSTSAWSARPDSPSPPSAAAHRPRNDAERWSTGPGTGGPPPRQTKAGGQGWQKTA
eukprot:2247463-Rhodomonas_salina.1